MGWQNVTSPDLHEWPGLIPCTGTKPAQRNTSLSLVGITVSAEQAGLLAPVHQGLTSSQAITQ